MAFISISEESCHEGVGLKSSFASILSNASAKDNGSSFSVIMIATMQ